MIFGLHLSAFDCSLQLLIRTKYDLNYRGNFKQSDMIMISDDTCSYIPGCKRKIDRETDPILIYVPTTFTTIIRTCQVAQSVVTL